MRLAELARVTLSSARPLLLATLLASACGGGDLTGRDAATSPRDAQLADGGIAVDAETATDAGVDPSCEEPPPASALAFDGVDDSVSMGVAPALGLERFTVEAWVRRDGRGVAAGTGVGGLSIVPIAGKGRGESDGTNLDCNYAFGFVGDVLGADFEDMASGANHPVLGRTRVPRGEWHHVAATYDGTTWRLYLDGALDGESVASATPRHDSIQHFGIGTMFDSMGRPAGRLRGAVDEVRVWDRARTADELAAGRFQAIDAAEGLVGRWALDIADDGAPDSAGSNDGTISGATFVAEGAILGAGEPPRVSDALPADDAVLEADAVELSVAIADPDDTAFTVAFHVREVTDADDFTIVVLPDTQYYTVQGNDDERYFYDQTQWVVDNRDAYGIAAVIHNGDLVDHGDRYAYEWMVADRAMSTLEEPLGGLLDGMPYGIAVGNHDQATNGATGMTVSFNEHFGVARFDGRAYYGDHYGRSNDESWFTFSAGGLDFVVVNLQYDTTPEPAVLAWARRIFEAHPDSFGILNSHYIVGGTGNFGPQGAAIYAALRGVPNLQLMTSGHIGAEARRTDTHEGNVIHSMLADYQNRAESGSGWMRIWELSPANDELTVRTYSPTLDRWETDANSEFTLPVDLRGSGGAFVERARVEAAGAVAAATIEGLAPGGLYEWYATVSDCAHTVRTPVARFTTSP